MLHKLPLIIVDFPRVEYLILNIRRTIALHYCWLYVKMQIMMEMFVTAISKYVCICLANFISRSRGIDLSVVYFTLKSQNKKSNGKRWWWYSCMHKNVVRPPWIVDRGSLQHVPSPILLPPQRNDYFDLIWQICVVIPVLTLLGCIKSGQNFKRFQTGFWFDVGRP